MPSSARTVLSASEGASEEAKAASVARMKRGLGGPGRN